MSVYFNDPASPDNLSQHLDQVVKPILDAATRSIDVTSFDLNLPDLVHALVSAAQRGVRVRVVYDGTNGLTILNNELTNNLDFDAIQTLTAAKIPVVDGGRAYGLMHDKMLIVDSKILLVGSWNLSYTNTYYNYNNLLKITDPTLIANYQAKFNELFVTQAFGSQARVKALTPSLNIDGVPVENYFSPPDHIMNRLVAFVQGAQKKIHFMIFTYTAEELASAMIDRFKAGVEVQGVIENRGANQGALVPLFCARLPVKTDSSRYTLHHKVMVIDDRIVITGSFNFTRSADEVNDDNVLVIHSPAVAALYEQEFQKLYAAGALPTAADVKCK